MFMEKIISDQRRKDLEAATKLYLDGYREQNFDVSGEFAEYAGFYHLTNEPFSKVLEIVSFSQDSRVLSVLASGDQVFHLINAGVQNIDTFDINRMTEYYALGFKKRAIECLSFEEFNKLFDYYKDYKIRNHCCENLDIEEYVVENMEEEYKWFWQELIWTLKQYGFDASVFHFATDPLKQNREYKLFNQYMINKEQYKILQQNILKSKITFKQSSVVDIPQNFSKYDLIYLSNIMEYYQMFYGQYIKKSLEAKKLLTNIYKKNLNKNGEILMTDLMNNFLSILLEHESLKESRLSICSSRVKAYTLKKEKIRWFRWKN